MVSPLGLSRAVEPQHPSRVALVDLRLVLVGRAHARHGCDRIADVVGPEEPEALAYAAPSLK
jgi:hypothetical protein